MFTGMRGNEMSNRKAAETYLIEEMKAITPGGGNGIIYQRRLSAMSDKEFEDFVVYLEQGGDLAIWVSNTDRKEDIDFEDMVKRCERLGRPVYQRIVSYDIDTGLKSMSPHKHFVGTAELIQQSQMWVKKVNAAENDSKVDDLTGQVMMESRATGLSIPEVSVMGGALGLVNTTNEIYNVKGGDTGAAKSYRTDLIETGKTNTNACLHSGDIAKSLRAAHYWFRGRLLDNNLDKRYG